MDKRLPLSKYVMLDRERCIICKRCVRFQDEIAGEKEIEMIHRGWQTFIGTAEGTEFTSIFSGNTIDICPVGALTDRTWRFQARPWEMEHYETVCAKCPVNCSIYIGSRDNKALRVIAAENDKVNDVWLCDKGKFEFKFPDLSQRILSPLIRRPSSSLRPEPVEGSGQGSGELEPAGWDEALEVIANRFAEIKASDGSDAFGFLGTAGMTNEEAYLFQRFARTVIGTNNVDFTERDGVVSVFAENSGSYGLSLNVIDLQKADFALVFGCDLYHHMPIAWLWVLQAVQDRGAKLAVVGVDDPEKRMRRHSWRWLPANLGALNAVVKSVIKVVCAVKQQPEPEAVKADTLEALCAEAGLEVAQVQQVGEALSKAERPVVLCSGSHDPEAVTPDLVAMLCQLLHTPEWRGVGYCLHHANERGCFESGLSPHLLSGQKPVADEQARMVLSQLWNATLPTNSGLSAQRIMERATSGDLKALWVVENGITQFPSFPVSQLPFLVVQSAVMTELAQQAHVVLPDQTFAEKNGTYTNVSGLTQAVRRTIIPPSSARSVATVVQAVAEKMGKPMNYPSPKAVQQEMERLKQLSSL